MIGPLATNEALAIDGYIRETKVPVITTTSSATVDVKSHTVNPWVLHAFGTAPQVTYPLGDYAAKTLGWNVSVIDAAGNADQANAAVQNFAQRGAAAIVDMVFPYSSIGAGLDAAQQRYYYFAVPKNAQHPNAARLYALFTMTEEGQKLAYDTWKTDLHLLPGSRMGKMVDDFQKRGVKFKEVTVDWWNQHPEIDATKSELIKILTTKG